jgi:hypothetical protein
MSDAIDWSVLHGALLDAVVVDWRNGLARVDVLSGPNIPLSAWVRVSSLASLAVDVKSGPATGDRIAEVRASAGQMEITTRSGGTIRIVAAGFGLERSER